MNIYGISRIPETVRTKKIVGTSFVLGTVQVLAGNQIRIDAVLLVVDCWSATDGAYHNIGIYFLISPEQHSCSVDKLTHLYIIIQHNVHILKVYM